MQRCQRFIAMSYFKWRIACCDALFSGSLVVAQIVKIRLHGLTIPSFSVKPIEMGMGCSRANLVSSVSIDRRSSTVGAVNEPRDALRRHVGPSEGEIELLLAREGFR